MNELTLQEEIEVARFLGIDVWDMGRVPARYVEQALVIIRAKRGDGE